MNRRQFLQLNALALASTSLSYASNDMQNHHMTHTMNHSNIDAVNTDTSFITLAPKTQLLDEKAFERGVDLASLELLKNESKESNFFRASIEIAENEKEFIKGKKTHCFTYNGLVPGPKIEVYEGDTVEILVKNKLKEPTTIHWHGLPVPPEHDGNPHDAIAPNRERIYRFQLPENSAGTYWYHPHPHFLSSKQVAKGLAGVFVVKAKKDALSHLKERDLMISDLRLDEKAQIPENTLLDWLNGREGEFVLINGQFQPQITFNEAERIRIYNCCAARYLNLRIQGVQFVLVGTDGGLLEKPQLLKELFLSPASRVEVLLQPTKKGQFELETVYYNRNKMLVQEKQNTLTLASISIQHTTAAYPQTLRKFQPLKQAKAFKEIQMSEANMMKLHSLDDANVFNSENEKEIKTVLASMFLLNGKTFDIKRIDLHSKLNEVEEWIVTNNSHMDHPFHIHGTQFELISSKINGKVQKAEFRSLKDTINVRPNEELRLRMVQNFTGTRMYHCHILEHEDLGMMGNLEVEE
ncbi:multicopper oxidase family protein [Campylobacter sp. MIT 21-1685]|uniref:multicopper oxidase family protein n=1 Tax=unclassified Campylobacter TaxID=2593542 RepID=UPI00224A5A05|nr:MULTISPECIES: multicopper oxidase family protein [unclassified Campylobacter]MCX2683057.1 multicopper oxidase family protein [Campylobacter sp. MIT 21-1684]MCX2751339.1 multicopper oxidase family protein [Campylobacter sp. MIT 21-1682]MCX2807538.1 multicopper oxidase family protein [Campylobacter sp. MIT 21-1685]